MEGQLPARTYEVFRGSPENGAMWIDSADTLVSAINLMWECAKAQHGSYFVFDIPNQTVVASTDKSKTKTIFRVATGQLV